MQTVMYYNLENSMIESKHVTGTIILWAVFAVLLCPPAHAEQDTGDQTLNEGANNKLIKSLSGKIDSADECYELIKRRLLEGDFEDVKAALDMRDEDGKRVFTSYRFARLRARCARVIFRLYARSANPLGWPSEKHGADMRRLAKDATTAYEEAFKLAGSDFEKACVYARWHELHANRRFEADSKLLRSGSPLQMPDEKNKEIIAKQVEKLKPVISKTLESVKASGKLSFDIKTEEYIKVFTDEYSKLAKMGVPDDIFDEILEDVGQFLQKAIDESVLTNPKKYSMTIRYYIWYALTGFRPDKIDNEYIDKTIKTVDMQIRKECQESLPEYEDDMSSLFLR